LPKDGVGIAPTLRPPNHVALVVDALGFGGEEVTWPESLQADVTGGTSIPQQGMGVIARNRVVSIADRLPPAGLGVDKDGPVLCLLGANGKTIRKPR
jgi:hypothetical protein